MKKLLLLLVPLLFAKPPAFLEHTLLPPQFTATFSIWQDDERPEPSHKPDNTLYYLEVPHGPRYMKAHFAQSVLLPGEPRYFKGTPVCWYITPDPSRGGVYTARVYSEKFREWVLVAVNLGPPRRDLIARFYEHLTVAPVQTVPDDIPAGPRLRKKLSNIPSEWFFTSGNNLCGPSKKKPGYFALRMRATVGPHKIRYRLPLSLVGGGAGALHQAYGQLVYEKINLRTLTPADFALPTGYRRVIEPDAHPVAMEALVKANCAVCHYKADGPTTLYQPEMPKLPNPPTPQPSSKPCSDDD